MPYRVFKYFVLKVLDWIGSMSSLNFYLIMRERERQTEREWEEKREKERDSMPELF